MILKGTVFNLIHRFLRIVPDQFRWAGSGRERDKEFTPLKLAQGRQDLPKLTKVAPGWRRAGVRR